MPDQPATAAPRRRLRECVAAWPDCREGDYNPKCCRFPKSCSCDIYDEQYVTEADLEKCNYCGRDPLICKEHAGERQCPRECSEHHTFYPPCLLAAQQDDESRSQAYSHRPVSENEVVRLRRVERYAREVMDALQEHGASIVGHLLDDDNNSGERLRQALAQRIG